MMMMMIQQDQEDFAQQAPFAQEDQEDLQQEDQEDLQQEDQEDLQKDQQDLPNVRLVVQLHPSCIVDYRTLNEPELKKTRRKVDPELEYDLNDGFIDDSDIFAVPQQENDWDYGYFVYRGTLDNFKVAKLKRSKTKPVKVLTTPKADPKATPKATQKATPKPTADPKATPKPNADPKATPKATATTATPKATADPKQSTPSPVVQDTMELAPSVTQKLNLLKELSAKHDWAVKSSFPEHLKPCLIEAATMAMDYAQLSPSFFKTLIDILPYNTFTLRRLVCRLTYTNRLSSLKDQVSRLYTDFAAQISKEVAIQGNPNPKFKWNKHLKIVFWNILCIEWEMAHIDNDTNELFKRPIAFNEANVRRAAYDKMLEFWPAGFMDSAQLSSQYSSFKIKQKGIGPSESHGYTIRADPFGAVAVKRPESAKKRKVSNSLVDGKRPKL